MNPIISIIIPVYGAEKYIEKCIQSIKLQSFKDFEAILINDGTKDRSINIAEKTIDSDDRFIILHKENGGQGSARNLGLDFARGEYIAFIDSDDYVEPNFLEFMYKQILMDRADICTCNVNIISSNGKLEKKFISNPLKFQQSNDYLNAHFYVSNWMCDKLFKKDVFENVRFDSSIRTYEDAHLVFRLLYNKKITKTDHELYNYIQHKGSTSNDIKPTYLADRLSVFSEQKKFYDTNDAENTTYIEYVYLKTFVFLCIVNLARHSKNYKLDVVKLKKLINHDVFSFTKICNIIRKDKKVGLSLMFFKLSPIFFFWFVKFWFRNKSL